MLAGLSISGKETDPQTGSTFADSGGSFFVMLAAAIGIFFTNPSVQLKAFTGWNIGGQTLFPFLFITAACGAVSGFHSLIGYGSMLIECVLAVIALIAVGYMTTDGAYAEIGTPSVVFATAISSFFAKMGLGDMAVTTMKTIIF